jgi:hypothetical protein
MSSRHRRGALLCALIAGAALAEARAGQAPGAGPTVLNGTPFEPLPLGSIKPAGWLKEQLRIQADGLSGHLDEFWPDIKDSAWFGGRAEGWERVPYWLDGVVPLAFALEDGALEAKVKRSIDYILAHQHADGWLGPVGDNLKHKPYDVWPLFPLFKALTQYQEVTNDPRIVPALLSCCRKIDQLIEREPLYSWARFRAADLALSLYWLHDRTKEAWLLDLARKAFAQSHDWRAQFDDFRFTAKTQGKFELDTHGVNTGMALKYGGLRYRLTGDAKDKDAVFRTLELLDRHHGQATGTFTCDEHLAGRSPSQGTELCTVVEAMFSLEVLAAVLADPRLGDRLEMLAFNALPATFKKDMTAHQYDQQCNQVICQLKGEHVYVDNGPASNLYGLEPNFGCCTANMHQGWPKLASHLWMKSSDGGLAAVVYAPCVVLTSVGGHPVRLEVRPDDGYPFGRDQAGARIVITIGSPEPVRFPLHLRVPAWAEGAHLATSGDEVRREPIRAILAGTDFVLARDWGGRQPSDVILTLPMPLRLREGYNRALSIQRGPLIYALGIEAEWRKIKDRPDLPFDDWEAYPRTPWNYALQLDPANPARSIRFEPATARGSVFTPEGARWVAKVQARRLPGWGLERGAAAPPPRSPVTSALPLEELTLIPYGCTDLRVTEFPFCH